MTVDRPHDYLLSVLRELRKMPTETEWVEFKQNIAGPDDIGEYISALSNSAALLGKVNAWMVWGINDCTHALTGTTFVPALAKVGNEELESWLLHLLTPKVNFRFHSVDVEGNSVVMLEIQAAFRHPVRFKHTEYLRIGSYKKKLKDHAEKERELWRVFDHTPFEQEIAADNMSAEEVLQRLDYPAYFDLLSLPLPEGREGILAALESEDFIVKNDSGAWNITNLGAILFARKLGDFHHLKRKSVRVILYQGDNKVETIREQEDMKGYASGFEGMIAYIATLLPSNEMIGQALRKDVPMFPELAIRELVANAMIHQDLHATGTSLMIELFSNRVEVTNPGQPLVKTERFLDSPPKSRNEALASFMRRIGICEERGTGVDKIVFEAEFHQLPAPLFESSDEHTRAILFAYRALKDMDKDDRVRSCYLHACLKYVDRVYMTNSTLRQRFGIDGKNSATASRMIRESVEAKLIRPYDESASKKFMKYIPFWA